jgi:HEAT repeat protein
MHNYQAGLVWSVNQILFVALAALGLYIILYVYVKDFFAQKHAVLLQEIKHSLYESVLTGKKPGLIVSEASALSFLDVVLNRNREVVFFNDAEQKAFMGCFITPKKIAELQRIALASKNRWRRVEAILSLGYAGDESALATLRKTIRDRNENIRYFSMLALGQIKSAASAKILLEFLKKNISAGFKVASILENFPSEAAVEAGELLKDRSADVRFWALKIISRFKSAAYIKEIESLAADKFEHVRSAALECLGTIGERQVKETLSERMKDDSWLVRISAVKAYDQIFGKEAIPGVIELINDGSLSVIDAVRDVLAAHIEDALPYIEKFFAGNDDLAKRVAVEALENSNYLLKMFKDILTGVEKERAASLKMLQGLIKSRAVFGLESALNNFDAEAREKLLKAVFEIDNVLADSINKNLRARGA